MRTVGVLAGTVVLTVSLSAAALAQTYLEPEEAQSLGLLNGTRAQAGRADLPRHGALDGIARAQAVRMAERGDIYHNPNLSSDADAAGLDWRRLGENVGTGPDVQSIHDAFVASPNHYDNMIWPTYNAIGVGMVSGNDGRMYVAHVFAELVVAAPPVQPAVAPVPAQAPAPPPRTAAPASRPAPVLAAVPSPEHRSPEPNALEGGVVNLRVVFGVTDRASVDDLVRTVAGLGHRPASEPS